jgi:hypothetical protein
MISALTDPRYGAWRFPSRGRASASQAGLTSTARTALPASDMRTVRVSSLFEVVLA